MSTPQRRAEDRTGPVPQRRATDPAQHRLSRRRVWIVMLTAWLVVLIALFATAQARHSASQAQEQASRAGQAQKDLEISLSGFRQSIFARCQIRIKNEVLQRQALSSQISRTELMILMSDTGPQMDAVLTAEREALREELGALLSSPADCQAYLVQPTPTPDQ